MSNSEAVSEPMKSIVTAFHLRNEPKLQALIDTELKPLVASGAVPEAILGKLLEARLVRSQGDSGFQALESAIEIWNKAQTKTDPDQ
jgi:hypothetical protein